MRPGPAFLCFGQIGSSNVISIYRLTINYQRTYSALLTFRILHYHMQLLATEYFINLKLFPVRRYGRIDLQSVKVRTHTQNTLYAANHNRRCCTGQPVYMSSAFERTLYALGKLPVTIWLQFPDLRLVIHGCR